MAGLRHAWPSDRRLQWSLRLVLVTLCALGVGLLGWGLGIRPPRIPPVHAQAESETLLDAVTTGSATRDFACGIVRPLTIYVVWSAGVTAGAVTLEEAHIASYAGTWSELTTVTVAAASVVDAVHLDACIGILRVRVSTTVVDGTVTVIARSDT